MQERGRLRAVLGPQLALAFRLQRDPPEQFAQKIRAFSAARSSPSSGNYGYAGSVQDYQETLNGALDAASMHLAESQGFRAALCHCAD